ncbi:MAG: (2Fe-2S) ferredoxin domain-containing protein [Candidatus Abyssobacteria bacterium SURF_17]|uniref:(2Fe-2S) ferredoxin domain-containing protein n=1 Tax=Candidatus Abyssobacteria bacterium SURF_17 TaxID=2093361 RepID=A0A419ERD2_9BACT|nr:MAG: (2Fe-2S) ferredoxin domain-containing protein [Candidatus Abyssubacteria bacterium SURF_17]
MEKKIKSVKDLNALRDQAKSDIELRTGEKDMRIVVHMGTCGIAAGARDILTQVIEELRLAGVESVTVRLSGCMGLCDQEPMFTLTDASGTEFCYARLDRSKVHEIVTRHMLENQPLVEYMVSSQSSKEA